MKVEDFVQRLQQQSKEQLKKVSTTQQKGILHTLENNTQSSKRTTTSASDDLKISFAKEKSSLADYDCQRDEQYALNNMVIMHLVL
jgi:Golgi nucleoside diphosphatase